MAKMNKTVDDYESAAGWSSKHFAADALDLILKLKAKGIKVDIGRTVIHIGLNLKAYVHHNGRSAEYATITDWNGVEIESFHYTEFKNLSALIQRELGIQL